MFSLRSIARAAPRALPRAVGTALRQPIQRALLKPATVTVSRMTSAPSFSTSAALARKGNSEPESASSELITKIESEIQFEEETSEKDQLPSSIKDWLENSEYALDDTPGQQSVKLTRDYKGEKITIRFSISDLDNFNDLYNEEMNEEGFPEDPNEVEDAPRGKQRGTPSRPAIEDDVAEDEEGYNEDDIDDEEPMSPPLHLNIVIEKPGKAPGALAIDATAQHGTLVVDNMAYYADGEVARGETSEAMAAQHKEYSGPPFASLDEDLQVIIDRFLEERGISTALAIFAVDYIDVKEQREYIRWLSNVKKFVSS